VSGKRFAPKSKMMIMRIMIPLGIPRLQIMRKPFGKKATGDSSIIHLVAALLRCYSAAAAGQFTSGVSLFEVYVAVVDQGGTPVSGLSRDDFIVVEDNAPQTLSAFA